MMLPQINDEQHSHSSSNMYVCINKNETRMLFNDIGHFFEMNSYGPIAALVCDAGLNRYCIIQPYNYYIIFRDKTIYLLLPSALREKKMSCTNVANSLMAAKFTETGLSYTCTTNTSFEHIFNIFKNNHFTKVVISREIKFFTIIALLNTCIEHGIFTL